MKKLIGFFLLAWSFSAVAYTYTFSWCQPRIPSPPYIGFLYQICIEETAPVSDTCTTPLALAWDTQHVIDAPDTANLWVRVRAVGYTSFSPMRWTNGPWSQIQIISGLMPPAIGGCP